MAKKPEPAPSPEVLDHPLVLAINAMSFEANIADVAVKLNVGELPIESIVFALEYGVRQYIQDGAAVSKTFTDKARKGQEKTEEEIATEKAEGVNERLDNLWAAEFARRGPASPKMTAADRHRDAIVMAKLEQRAKALGKKLPTKTGKKADPDALQALWDAMYKAKQVEVDAEVERRLAADAEAAAEDLTELDALLG
jgi:hypothetical protein